jgi:hypothetical protein
MKLKHVLILSLALSAFSCKKTRTCECKNSNGTYVAGEKEGTRYQAKKYCKSLTNGSTTCYLK